MKTVFAFFQKRPVSLFAVLLLLLLLGFRSGLSLPRSLQNHMTEEVLRICVQWPSWPAEQVRQLVCLPVEEAVAACEEITIIRSVCTDAELQVYLRCAPSNDVYALREKLAAALDALRPSLPHDIGLFELTLQPDAAEHVVTLAVLPHAEEADLTLLREAAERELGTRLARVEGALAVNILGGAEQECRVNVDERRSAVYGVNPLSLQNVLALRTRDISLGSITDGQRELSVLIKGLEDDLSALGKIAVSAGGLRLEDVASLELRERPLDSAAVLNGQDAVFVSVSLAAGVSPKSFYRRAWPYLQDFRVEHEQRYQLVLLDAKAPYSWLGLAARIGLLCSVAAGLILLALRLKILRYLGAAVLSLFLGIAVSLLLLDIGGLPLDAGIKASFMFAALVSLLVLLFGSRTALRLAAEERYRAARSFVCCVLLFVLPLLFCQEGFFTQAGSALLAGAAFCAAAVFCAFLVCPVLHTRWSGPVSQLRKKTAGRRRIGIFSTTFSMAFFAALALGFGGVLLFADFGAGTVSAPSVTSLSARPSALSLDATLCLPPSSLEERNSAMRAIGSQVAQLYPDLWVALSSVPEAEDFCVGFPSAAFFPGHRVHLKVYAATKAKAAALRPLLAEYLRQQEERGAVVVIEESAAAGARLAAGAGLPEYEYAFILAGSPAQLEARVGLLQNYSAAVAAEHNSQPIALLPPSSAQVLKLQADASLMARYGVDTGYLASLLASQIQDTVFADFRMDACKLPLSLSLSSEFSSAGADEQAKAAGSSDYSALLARSIPLNGGQGPRLGELLKPALQSRASYLLRLDQKDVYALRFPWKPSFGTSVPHELRARFPWLFPLCDLEIPPKSLPLGRGPKSLLGRLSLSLARIAVLMVGTASALLCLLGLTPRMLFRQLLKGIIPLLGGYGGVLLALSLRPLPAHISFTSLNAILVFAVCLLVCLNFILSGAHPGAVGLSAQTKRLEVRVWGSFGAVSLLLLTFSYLRTFSAGDSWYFLYLLSSCFSGAAFIACASRCLLRARPRAGSVL